MGAGAWIVVSAKDQGGNGKEIRWNGWEQENKGGKNTGEKEGYRWLRNTIQPRGRNRKQESCYYYKSDGADRLRKDIIQFFTGLGLRIKIQTNLKAADFSRRDIESVYWKIPDLPKTKWPTFIRSPAVESSPEHPEESSIFHQSTPE